MSALPCQIQGMFCFFFSPRSYKPTIQTWMWNYLNFLHLQLVQNVFKNTTGTKQKLPGGEICFMGFQHRSSEQAMVIRSAKCEEGKEVAHPDLQRRVSASQGADRGLSPVVQGQCWHWMNPQSTENKDCCIAHNSPIHLRKETRGHCFGGICEKNCLIAFF